MECVRRPAGVWRVRVMGQRLSVAGVAIAVALATFATPAAAAGGAIGGRGTQYLLNDTSTGIATTVFTYGDPDDESYVGDWRGKGADTLAVRRGNTFHVRSTNTSGPADEAFSYGDPGDTVLVGDWNGDGKDTLAVRRGNTFYVRNSTTSGIADTVFSYGDAGDTVLVGDWNGDGTDTLSVRRGNDYLVKNSLRTGTADATFVYGDPGDTVLVGHWSAKQSGDTLGVRRGAAYHLRYSLTTGKADRVVEYGEVSDTTLVGDWNGDGIDTLGVRRPTPARSPAWLDEFNRYRTAAGVAPVTENPTWTAGLLDHMNYLAKTPWAEYRSGEYFSAHTQNPASPYYTPAGALEAGRSVLIESGAGDDPLENLEVWLTAPYHAIPMLRPGLRQVAFASAYGNAGLDVTGGFRHTTHPTPVLFPGPGMTTTLTSFGGEQPNPLESCGSWITTGDTYGLPLIAMLPESPVAGSTATVTGTNGVRYSTAGGSLCLIDEHTFRSTDSAYGPNALATLRHDHGMVLIAERPYRPGTYTATINQPGKAPVTWSFTVS